MKLSEAQELLVAAEVRLGDGHMGEFHVFECCGRKLHVYITSRLRKRARKAGMWGGKPMLGALKNAMYGFDPERPRSRGGADGIFLVDKKHRPRNSMMTKLFDDFLEKPDGAAEEIAAELEVDVETLLAVRLVSHDLRLLGVLARGDDEDRLVLVDLDRKT